MGLKTQGKCVFCAGTGLSKEHIWSDWLSDLIKLPEEPYTHRGLRTQNLGGLLVITPESIPGKVQRGSMLQRKIRQVCRSCNSGWMSVIVNEAKQFAEPLIQGAQITLNASAQTKLASWIAITSMMAEFTDRSWAKVPRDEFAKMKILKKPLPNWTIGIGLNVAGNWWPHRYRHCGVDVAVRKGNIYEVEPVHMTTFTLKNLAVHVVSSPDPNIISKVRQGFFTKSLIQIWPVLNDTIESNNIPSILEHELISISGPPGGLANIGLG